MVDIVSGSGISRILSFNEVQEDTVQRQNVDRAADALSRRRELAEAAVLRGDATFGFGRAGRTDRNEQRDLPADQPDRFPRLANFVADPESVNQILEDSQGVDQALSASERLRQAAVIDDSFRRSFFISMIDPGRAMTMLGTRETYGMDEDT